MQNESALDIDIAITSVCQVTRRYCVKTVPVPNDRLLVHREWQKTIIFRVLGLGFLLV